MGPRPTEIKIQGYGGQGVVTAVEILAVVMSKAGYYVQSFSQYGAERRGGTVESHLRISKGPIFTHSAIYESDYLVLANQALMDDPQLPRKVREGGVLFVNASRSVNPPAMPKSINLLTLDADRIAAKHDVRLPSGATVINTTIVGGMMALFPDVPFSLLREVLQEKKVPATEKNLAAAEEAFTRVKAREESREETGPDREKIGEKRRSPSAQPAGAPCEAECPAGVPVREIVNLIALRKLHKAFTVLKRENPLPAITGRACFHPCEAGCNRNGFDEGIAIGALERAASEHGGPDRKEVQRAVRSNAKRVAVIGSGPAGMSCAHFLRLMDHRVTMLEALPVAGGIPRIAIPAYRLPRGIVDQEIGDLVRSRVEVRTGVEVTRKTFQEIMASHDACFVATGAHRPVRLNLRADGASLVVSGLEFLKRVALGEQAAVSGRVCVIGGGNTAIDSARTAKKARGRGSGSGLPAVGGGDAGPQRRGSPGKG